MVKFGRFFPPALPYPRDKLTSRAAGTGLSPAIGAVIGHNTLNSERNSRAIIRLSIENNRTKKKTP